MKVHIDKNRCTGCEVCINRCTEVFMIWGRYMRADFDVPSPEKNRAAVEDAARLCPQQAITIHLLAKQCDVLPCQEG